ncbi:L-type lectin-domain containing receptor kinase IX.2 [Hibiscus syriacus]|uniref:L-type lectin-domain containing receptor kinase IX.2 n=1 Tax=Hibiscus syriacus TaxID=106335 RepID=A0A6A3AG95_HIBSY|nr:L-type lectin-domain containing receptor kinase IX.2 [Hibiscus syriacus]
MQSSSYGHGITFFLAPVGFQGPLNSAGEFDKFENPEWDPAGVDKADVVIDYNATTNNLVVSWSYQTTNNPRENCSLSYLFDLIKVLREWIMVGLSVATGQYVESHTLHSWEFNSSLTVEEETSGNTARNVRILIGIVVPVGVVIAGTVTVKSISSGSRQGEKEYVTEVKVISQLRHRNLVQLIGCCHDRNDFILVYEFMPNDRRSPLTWPVRYHISLGLASALLYLQEEWEQYVVHLDINSSNTMLDSSFNVKLGDLGLAKLMNHELGLKTTGLAGTIGYLAPEYISTGRACKESDVYSFGVVLLEIATGRKSVDPRGKSDMGLVEWIWGLYGKGELLLAVDGMLGKDFDEKPVECLMTVLIAEDVENRNSSFNQNPNQAFYSFLLTTSYASSMLDSSFCNSFCGFSVSVLDPIKLHKIVFTLENSLVTKARPSHVTRFDCIDFDIEDQLIDYDSSIDADSFSGVLSRILGTVELECDFSFWCFGVVFRNLILFPVRALVLTIGWIIFLSCFIPVHFLLKGNDALRKKLERVLVELICSFFVASWTGVVKYHGPRPSMRPKQVFVANHTSMIDFIILEQMTAFAVIMQKHPGWVGSSETATKHYFRECRLYLVNRSEAKDREIVAKKLRDHSQGVDNKPPLIFPEGTCVNNQYSVMFKKSFTMHLLQLMTSWAVVCDVWYLEPQNLRPGETPIEFAERQQTFAESVLRQLEEK